MHTNTCRLQCVGEDGSHRAMFFDPVGVRLKTRLAVGLRGTACEAVLHQPAPRKTGSHPVSPEPISPPPPPHRLRGTVREAVLAAEVARGRVCSLKACQNFHRAADLSPLSPFFVVHLCRPPFVVPRCRYPTKGLDKEGRQRNGAGVLRPLQDRRAFPSFVSA